MQTERFYKMVEQNLSVTWVVTLKFCSTIFIISFYKKHKICIDTMSEQRYIIGDDIVSE